MTEAPHPAELRFRVLIEAAVSVHLLFGLDLIGEADGKMVPEIRVVLGGGMPVVGECITILHKTPN